MVPEDVWFMIKETEGVGDFIGSNGKPSADVPPGAGEASSKRPTALTKGLRFKTAIQEARASIKVTNGPFDQLRRRSR